MKTAPPGDRQATKWACEYWHIAEEEFESGIRRVINLRLKGNSISWYEENAEGMLLLRCLALSNRWDDAFAEISASLASTRRLDWTFGLPDMTSPAGSEIAIEPPKPQVTATPILYATNA